MSAGPSSPARRPRALRVLLITSAFPTQAGDPRGVFIWHLARELRRHGVEVSVLAPGAPGARRREVWEGVEIQRVSYWVPRWQALSVGVGGIVPNLRRRPWLLPQVPCLVAALAWRAFRLGRHFDVIHAHWVYPAGIAGRLTAKRYRIPLVVTSHGGDLNLARRSRVLRAVSGWIARSAEARVAVSQAMVDEFARLGVPRSSVDFVPLGIATAGPDQPDSAVVNDQWQRFARGDGLRVVYVGSLIPRKSVETLLRAHGLLQREGRKVATLIVGDGPSEKSLRAIAAREHLHDVIFAGAQAPATIPTWMSAGEVLVLPSLSEGRGLVIVEAMALGLTVVASDIPGPRELIRHGETGLLFPPGDSGALATCLKELSDNPARRVEMSRGGRELVRRESLTVEACAERHVDLYSRVVGGDPADASRDQDIASRGAQIRAVLRRFTRSPVAFTRRAMSKLVFAPLRYRRGRGYDAERYWADRLSRYGSSLRGPGHEGLSEEDNRRQYEEAGAILRQLCHAEGIDLGGARVLEVGCATGSYARLCRDAGVRDYVGIDITDVLFASLQAQYPMYEFRKQDITTTPIAGQFDVILLIDVLEHVVETPLLQAALANVSRCLSTQGVLIIALPLTSSSLRPLFYMRYWSLDDIKRALPDYTMTQLRRFRDGQLFAARRQSATASSGDN